MDPSTAFDDARRQVTALLLNVAANSLDALIEEAGIEVSPRQYSHALIAGYYRAEDFVPPQRPEVVSAVAEVLTK